jgi:hypothetical protein
MIARPNISRNEWKTAETGAFEVGHVALSCRPGADRAAVAVREGHEIRRAVAVAAKGRVGALGHGAEGAPVLAVDERPQAVDEGDRRGLEVARDGLRVAPRHVAGVGHERHGRVGDDVQFALRDVRVAVRVAEAHVDLPEVLAVDAWAGKE